MSGKVRKNNTIYHSQFHLEEEREAEKEKEKNSELVQLENERNNLQTQCDDLQKTITGLESKFIDFAKSGKNKPDAILNRRKCSEEKKRRKG